jgi:hypothetical protein
MSTPCPARPDPVPETIGQANRKPHRVGVTGSAAKESREQGGLPLLILEFCCNRPILVHWLFSLHFGLNSFLPFFDFHFC